MHTVHERNFYGISKSSIFTSSLFNIFLRGLFYFLDVTAEKKKTFRNRRNGALFRISFQLFDFSYVNINSGKNHILFSANNAVRVYIDNNVISSENKNELLGIDLDSNLSYEKQPL